MKKISTLCAALLMLSGQAAAQSTSTQPAARLYHFDDGGYVQCLSDNGLWAAFSGASSENATRMEGARLVNVTTNESFSLIESLNTDTISADCAADVTNDGNTVVGSLNSKPAFYDVASDKWTFLPLKDDADRGQVNSVTPDGKYAVGVLNYSSASRLYEEVPALWDLQTGSLIETPGLPTKDMAHLDQKQNRFVNISADGTKVLGCMSYSYLPSGNDAGGIFYYVWDRTEGSYRPIGFEDNDTEDWTPRADGLLYIDQAVMSNNGQWVTGTAYISHDTGSEYGEEYVVPFKYNVTTDEFMLYDDDESHDMAGSAIDNDGEVYAASPQNNPYRSFSVRSGKYWVEFFQTINQHYDLDLSETLGTDISGTPITVSDDGLTLGSLVGTNESYLITLPEKFSTTAASTNLLSSYTVEPKSGTRISRLTTLKLTFDRDVQVLGSSTDVELRKIQGNQLVCNSSVFSVDASNSKAVNITFRSGTLESGYPHRVIIPAQSICIEGDATRYNDEIRITYVGRDNAAVRVSDTTPNDGASLGKIDYTTSPVILEYDTDLKLADDATNAALYQEGVDGQVAQLLLSVSGTKLYVYPATTQYLYKGAEYRIEVPAGVVTDVTGNEETANEAYTLKVKGAYEREISYENNVLYENDFSQGITDVMLLDNDGLTPNEESSSYGFQAGSEYAWIPVSDSSTSSDMAAASTSMYSPAGKSDDWMTLPQINLSDEHGKLTFKSQSLRKNKTDRLKVYVWPSNAIYTAMSAELAEKMRTEGTLVYNEIQTPGESEDAMEGDWRENSVSLADFAGQNVYIAFVNDNEDQSIVMVDDVKVVRERPFYVTLNYDPTVVAQKSAAIGGKLTIQQEDETFTTASITLKDADGNTVSQIEQSGLSLEKDDELDFTFPEELQLAEGQENDFKILFRLNAVEDSVTASVKNLSFSPTKRVVLEEYTGVDCSNCPLGILAIENLENIYGDLFIPLALHCYTGDPFSTGVTSYSNYLGFSAAPSGRVQRGDITSPMYSSGGSYSFTSPDSSEPTWLQAVAEEMDEETEAEVTATASLDASATTYTVPCEVRFALRTEEANLKLFAVVLENGLVSYQSSNVYNIEDPNLGEWGKGGAYASSIVSPYTFDHVVRGYYGDTFTGTPGLLPTTLEAGTTYSATLQFSVPSPVRDPESTEIVVMLFDGNTDELINSCKAEVGKQQGIEQVGTQAQAPQVKADASGRILVSTTDEATATAYSADGRTIARAAGSGQLTLSTEGYKGVAIVLTRTAGHSYSDKVILK